MIELSSSRKIKINLSDYEYQKDLENRLLMANFSALDLEVLEEILYSSIKIPIPKLLKNLEISEQQLLPSLDKLNKSGLLTVDENTIIVDKEMRKYYEFQILKFDDDFKPDMEFLQGLLRKVPIHVLPTWYAIPRTSNNIFESIIEKYLFSPQIFQRYLFELHTSDPIISGILNEVYSAPDFKVRSRDLREKFELSRENFEEYMLLLEFNLVACLSYNRIDDQWKEVVTPFHEWREYLRFICGTESSPAIDGFSVTKIRENDFAFIQDMTAVLELAEKKLVCFRPDISQSAIEEISRELPQLTLPENPFFTTNTYIAEIVQKLFLIKLLENDGTPSLAASDWHSMDNQNRAIYLYRFPFNTIIDESVPAELCNERVIREAEKSIKRILHVGWTHYEDFEKGIMVPLSEETAITLQRTGKKWEYKIPQYNLGQKALFRSIVFHWLFEVGMVDIGMHEGKESFCITAFGRSFFEA